MTSVTQLAEELQEEVAWQRTPEPLTLADYEKMIVKAIKRLFIDTGRVNAYSSDMLIEAVADEKDDAGNAENADDESGDTEQKDREPTSEVFFDYDFLLDEERYIFLVAQINFFKRVQMDVNNIVSYTTNAMSITNADKPYAHLQDSINQLENERRITYYKMVRFTIGVTGE